MEGFWFVRLQLGTHSCEGVVILDSGVLLGSDLEHCWNGTYDEDGSRLSMRIRLVPIVSSPEEDIMAREQPMILSLAGQCTDGFARLEGRPVDQENVRCLLVMRKCNAPPQAVDWSTKAA